MAFLSELYKFVKEFIGIEKPKTNWLELNSSVKYKPKKEAYYPKAKKVSSRYYYEGLNPLPRKRLEKNLDKLQNQLYNNVTSYDLRARQFRQISANMTYEEKMKYIREQNKFEQEFAISNKDPSYLVN